MCSYEANAMYRRSRCHAMLMRRHTVCQSASCCGTASGDYGTKPFALGRLDLDNSKVCRSLPTLAGETGGIGAERDMRFSHRRPMFTGQPVSRQCSSQPPLPWLQSSGKERYVFFSFPHISIDAAGNVGVISRPGRPGASCACGALNQALIDIKQHGIADSCESPGGAMHTHLRSCRFLCPSVRQRWIHPVPICLKTPRDF